MPLAKEETQEGRGNRIDPKHNFDMNVYEEAYHI
jgi:hypothetical protein